MKKLLLITVIFIFYGICLSGCTNFYPGEDLIVYTTRNAIYYEYQEKVAVVLRYSDRSDSLVLRTDETSESWISTSSYGILSGEFKKVGWYDDNLFILMEDKYYSIDIDEYEVPPIIEDEDDDLSSPKFELKEYSEDEFKRLYPIIEDEDDNLLSPEYELKEYSESEFKELYPDWESFDWYGH